MNTHWAIIVSSGRMVRVERCGRLLLVHGQARHGAQSVSQCRHDGRFRLLPKTYSR